MNIKTKTPSTQSELLHLADLALVPPVLNTHPTPEYGYDRLDYGMTIGIERTRGGRLWACWVGGADGEKAYFVLATSDDSGATWSDPRLVIDPHDNSLPLARRTLVGNLWLDPRGRLWLFFDQAMTYFDGRAGTWFTRCDNPDADNPAWTPPVRIWHGCSLNKPIVLSSGEWLLPVSLWDRAQLVMADVAIPIEDWPPNPFADSFHELDDLRMANVLVSHDEGETWERRGGVAFPSPNFDEHNLVERRDGSIWMTARTGENKGIWQSISHDGGVTWSSAEPSGLAHVSSRHFLRRLHSGRLLLVKHGLPVETRPATRSHLTAYLSDDDGSTWAGGLVLDERAVVSYPDGTQTPDGTIFVSYDLDRDTDGEILLARFSEEDVLAGKCVTKGSALRLLISRPDPEALAARHAARITAMVRKLLGETTIPFVSIPQWSVWDGAGEIDPRVDKGTLPGLATPLPPERSSGARMFDCKVLGPASKSGFVSLADISPAAVGKAGYARSFVYSPEARDETFLIGADFWMQFRVNGRTFVDHSREPRPTCVPRVVEYRVDAPLKAGWNLLEAKVASGSAGFAFSCLIGNPEGLGFSTDSNLAGASEITA